MPPHVAVVLHYESATYARWRRKFERLQHHTVGSAGYEQMSHFYAASVEAIRAVLEAPSAEAQARAEAAARALYAERK
eukprot:334476-Prymnesium_polylepis.1